ncbi:MAG: ribonucleotide-diphosphate reductase subunit beta [Acidobacteriota bacterium]|jgi:ribonucleoside-diphosphate reductase beta chain|nr:ribonucleotide-diphosphate reductase subunit beta [Bryobacteraceae bacterium CoA2 C42]MCA2966442.1 ribonucleotide-diphosphate reductase subunit beta [Acidobacteriaceae bacterium]
MILDPGFDLTLRPMKYPVFYDMYKIGIKNTWTVEEVDFSTDVTDLRQKMNPAEQHLIKRLVAFFATGDSIVGNNLVLNLYKHINSPEARMYLSRQLFEEAVHVQFYLTLLDTYIPDPNERAAAFSAVENIPSIKAKADFCFKWIDSINEMESIESDADMKKFLLNLSCFACCIEGMFFFAAFAYVYFLRSRGLLQGLATGTNWVFRDESAHIDFALEVINTVRRERPHLFDAEYEAQAKQMIRDAVECEALFAEDTLGGGISGMSIPSMRQYLQYIADRRLVSLGIQPIYGSKNPFDFMELQDVQELTNFFERRVSAYQTAVSGEVGFADDF